MVKSLVLHIGDPKTGTKSLQHVLVNRLYETKGTSLFYGKMRHANNLATQLIRPDTAPDHVHRHSWEALSRAHNNSDADIGIISGESFQAADPFRVKAVLMELFDVKATDIKVVCYLRPHFDALLSRYTQHVKNGQFTGTLDQYQPLIDPHLQYHSRIEKWSTAFDGHIQVLLYRRATLFQRDIVHDFFRKALGLENFSIEGIYAHNRSPSLKELALCCQYYSLLLGPLTHKTRRMYNYPRPYIRLDSFFSTLGNSDHDRTYLKVERTLWKRCHDHYRSDARKLDRLLNAGSVFEDALDPSELDLTDEPQDLSLHAHFADGDVAYFESLLQCIAQSSARLTGEHSETAGA